MKHTLTPCKGSLLILLWFLFTFTDISAQSPTVTIKARNITIGQAFRQIEAQTPYTIAFNRTKLDVDKQM